MRNLFALSLIAAGIAAAAGARPARACDLPPHQDAIRYWPLSYPVNVIDHDIRCDWDSSGGHCRLSGYIYRPSLTKANQPALVFMHGADAEVNQDLECNWIRSFYDAGYVV